jgi:hypothetical protein
VRPPCFGSVHNGREDFPRATFKRRITAVSVISDKRLVAAIAREDDLAKRSGLDR